MMARVGKGHCKGGRALMRWLGFPGGAGEEGERMLTRMGAPVQLGLADGQGQNGSG